MEHKRYIVTSTSVTGNWKNAEFDSFEESVKCADKRQKTRKSDIVILEKVSENESETIYNECYNAKGNPLIKVKYGFLKR